MQKRQLHSLKQKLASKLYPLALLKNKNKIGNLKNLFITIKGYRQIRKNNLFDTEYYLENHESVRKDGMDALLHYIYYGSKKGYNPSIEFNTNKYLKENKDVEKSNINPLIHYAVYGLSENRKNTSLTKKQIEKLREKINNDNKNKLPLIKKPLVSIIIITHNGENHIKRLLTKFTKLKQYNNYELIIWDNASEDNTKDTIKKFTNLNITLIENKTNETFSKANNEAVKKAKGNYLLFLNNDIEPLDGFINHLMNVILNKENVGCVGARLIYPDCSNSKINQEKSYTIQHEGIIFKACDYIKPVNKNNGQKYYTNTNIQVQQIIAITAACMLIKKSVFNKVGGFQEEYVYGYEDVDLCLKLHKSGYKNYYTPQAMLYHYEFGTQEMEENKVVTQRREKNHEIFIKKWNTYLKKQLKEDLINNNQIITDKSLTIAFVVTQAQKNTTAGDYFTAQTLASSLKREYGWNIKYLEKGKDWYNIPEYVDVIISMLDTYNIEKIKTNNKYIIKIAWPRNWFDRWMNKDYFKDYNIILSSSKKACASITQKTGKKAIFYPIATDTDMFNENISPQKKYESDYCFTGSYWMAKREIIDFLDPTQIKHTFKLYGANWDKIEKFKPYYQGFINYKEIPQIYASTKIVIDDANHVTKEWGSVNSRVFDTIASGKLVITNGNRGNQDLFNGKIPEYHSKEELKDVINYYMEHSDKRNEKIKELQKIVLNKHTYTIRAKKLKRIIEEYEF